MDFITSILGVTVPDLNFIGELINLLYKAVESFGWTIILFTLILKVITLPVEFWQRYVSHSNAEKMKQMKPMMDKIDKAYGENKRAAQAEKNKMFKKYGYSMVAGCLPMLLTMGIFIVMLLGLNNLTAHANAQQFNDIEDHFYTSISTTFKTEYAVQEYGFTVAEVEAWTQEDALAYFLNGKEGSVNVTDEHQAEIIAKAQLSVGEFANDNRQGFLWVKNIFRPDTWAAVMPTYDEFKKGSLGLSAVDVSGIDKSDYQTIYDGITATADSYAANGTWNGLLLLPLLSLVTQFFSMRLTMRAQTGLNPAQAKDSSDPTVQSQKMMQWTMPLVMVIFSLFYTASFALYIVSNAILSIVTNLAMTPIIKAIRKNRKVSIVGDVSYRR